MRNRLLLIVAAPLAAVTMVSGCSSSEQAPKSTQGKIIQLVPIPGGDLHQITLAQVAITSLGIQTQPLQQGKVRLQAGGAVNEKNIPFGAVIYDPSGSAWTYTTTGPRSFVRSPITIDRIDGDTALLKAGPAAGTPVVTVGAPELLGAEYGVGEE